jgi:hypothetical protein
MKQETIDWWKPTEDLPDDGEQVVIENNEGELCFGYRDGDKWLAITENGLVDCEEEGIRVIRWASVFGA